MEQTILTLQEPGSEEPEETANSDTKNSSEDVITDPQNIPVTCVIYVL